MPSKGKLVTWYSCGPTVYDASHMGHARTYVAIDIIRRIMQDYFGYMVVFVQNVTDIDDKIIVRARQNYIWDKFAASQDGVTTELRSRARAAWSGYARKLSSSDNISLEIFSSWLSTVDRAARTLSDPKFPMHLTALERARLAILDDNMPLENFLQDIKDVYLPQLDQEEGASVTDLSVFSKLTQYWEMEYNEDMSALGVLPPSKVIRVSEVVPSIVNFVEKIVNKGRAYATSDGSVYFSISTFEKDGFDYAKLSPQSRGDKALMEEGEGSLSTNLSGKRSPDDFALWKASKPGEPAWNSPWGMGRPGWHIECSVMASEALGNNIDIHSGGIDLTFPHHDNELAQSEAYHDVHQWVNYFFHTGHLHIEGQKMSKSLKNFITIKQALEMYTSRQLRLAFMMQQWDAPMNFKADLIQQVRVFEETLSVSDKK